MTAAEENDKLHSLLMQIIFIYRSYLMDDDYYYADLARADQLEQLVIKFVKDFESYFGVSNAFYNLHILTHLRFIREALGPLTDYSAFTFESFYALINKNMCQRTQSLGKQSMKGVAAGYWSKRDIHKCVQPIRISTKVTAYLNDTIIATSIDEVIKVIEVDGDTIVGKKILTHEFLPNMTEDADGWRNIGVQCFNKYSNEIISIQRNDVYGKGVLCGNVITCVPNHVLRDH